MSSKIFLRRTYDAHRSHLRRAREVGAALDYDLERLRQFVAQAVNRPCPYCRRLVVDENFACDHRQATSRGGSFRLENLLVCCQRCNEIKGCLSQEEFTALLAFLALWPERAQADVLRRLRAGGRWR
jgi:5-methylcytosine-specific restriction endonuclease McrA